AFPGPAPLLHLGTRLASAPHRWGTPLALTRCASPSAAGVWDEMVAASPMGKCYSASTLQWLACRPTRAEAGATNPCGGTRRAYNAAIPEHRRTGVASGGALEEETGDAD